MSPTKLVSIIIPSYNHRKYIAETLASIQRQSYENIETIVIDDGSTDGSPQYLEELQKQYNFRLTLKKNEGLCATLNLGLSQARGDFVVIIASDDSMPEDRIRQQCDYFEKNDADVIAGGMTPMTEQSEALNYVKPVQVGELTFEDLLTKNKIYAPTAMFKSSTFLKYGRYCAEHKIEDYSMWLSILSQGGRILNFDENWAYYRIGPAITRQKVEWYHHGLMQVLQQYADKPGVAEALRLRKFIYLLKVALFEGFKGVKGQISAPPLLNLWQKISIYFVANLPQFVRNLLKKRINRF